ncbi:hypothetical protein AU476_31700 [Cupriavidus sp. UYMSc13B]|nr:hypothetical protein AU476_31700 [Cupriavidus sp. UYMSc13B]
MSACFWPNACRPSSRVRFTVVSAARSLRRDSRMAAKSKPGSLNRSSTLVYSEKSWVGLVVSMVFILKLTLISRR